MSIRSFIAVPIPREMANTLGDYAAQMAYQDKSNAVRWVDQGNFHITLAFLGEQNERELEALADQIDDHLFRMDLTLTLSHLSPFPESRPKLIAALVKRSVELESLHQQIMAAVMASSIMVERRRFIPHVTLGRYRHSRNQYAGAIPNRISAHADAAEVAIYESVLTPNGAEYEPLFRFPLNEFDYNEI